MGEVLIRGTPKVKALFPVLPPMLPLCYGFAPVRICTKEAGLKD